MDTSSRAARYVAFLRRRGALVLVAWAVLGALGAAGSTRLRIRADLSELLPAGDPGVEGLKFVADRVGGVVNLLCVVQGPEPMANRRFADDLVGRLRGYPPTQIRAIDYRVDDARRFISAHKWLYADLAELFDLRCALESAVWRHVPGLVSLEDCPSLEEMKDRFGARTRKLDRFPSGYIETADQRQLLITVWPHSAGWGAQADFALVDRIRAEVAVLRPTTYHPQLQVRLTGNLPIMQEEHAALKADLTLVSLLCLALVLGVVVLYFRTLRSVVLVFTPTLIATLAAFGLAGVLIGYLNTNTAFLGSIIVGNGINASIVLLARFQEERARGRADALATALRETVGATVVASFTAAGAYGSLLITSFRGFNQFGAIGLSGMVLCWVGAYTLLPALIVRSERRGPAATRGDGAAWLLAPLADGVLGAPRAILLLGAVAVLAAAVPVLRLARDPYEYNLRRLGNEHTLTHGAGAEMERVKAAFGRAFTPNLAIVPRPEDAAAIAGVLRQRDQAQAGGRAEALLVGEVHYLDEFVPERQQEKLAVVTDIGTLLRGPLARELPEADRARLQPYLPPADLRPFTRAELPESLVRPLSEIDGPPGRVVVAYFRSDRDMMDSRLLLRFARLGRDLPLPEGGMVDLSGRNVAWAALLSAIELDGPRASAAAVVTVLLLVALLFRRAGPVLAVFSAIACGTVCTAGLAAATGARLNFLNFVALPITLGVGADYSANLVHRLRRERDRGLPGLRDALRGTGGAMALCSLTTVIGYGSLLLAGNQALRSFGWLCALGEICCLFWALTMLPAGAALLLGRSSGPSAAPVLRSLAMAAGAFLLYGSWAWFANRGHGSAAAWRAAGTQGFVSFTATFFMTALMEGLSRLAAGRLSRFLLTAGVTMLLGALYVVGTHVWAGTPELRRTVAPILAVGAFYITLYSVGLLRRR